MSELIEKKMTIDSILPLVVEYRNKADWRRHDMSDSYARDPEPCTDEDVARFIDELNGDDMEETALIVSMIDWEECGNCEGDALYPVTLVATKIPGDRWFLELYGNFEIREFILD